MIRVLSSQWIALRATRLSQASAYGIAAARGSSCTGIRAECEVCLPGCGLTRTILALRSEVFQLWSVIGEADRRKGLDSPECCEPNGCIPSFGTGGCAAASRPIAEVGPADVFDQRCPLDPKIGIPAREFVPFVNPDSRNMPSGAVCCPCKDGFQPARPDSRQQLIKASRPAARNLRRPCHRNRSRARRRLGTRRVPARRFDAKPRIGAYQRST